MIGRKVTMRASGTSIGRRTPNAVSAELSNASNTSKAVSYAERLSAAGKAPAGAFGPGINYSGVEVSFSSKPIRYYWNKLAAAKNVRNVKKLEALVTRTPLSETNAGPLRRAINNRKQAAQAGLAPTLVQEAGSLARTAFAPTNSRATRAAAGMTNAQINAALASGQV
jgi:hypothetical protein